jgi:hypothetical protein
VYFDAHLKKERRREKRKNMNKIAYVFLAKVFKFQMRDRFSRSKIELGLATIYAHDSTHMHTLICLYDLTLFGSII